MKKILFLIHDLGQGGAEKVLVNLVNNMDHTKFNITVIALFGGGVNEQFLSDKVTYKTVFPKVFPGNSKVMKLLTPKQLHSLCVKDIYDIEVAYLEGPAARIISGCPNKETKLVSWIHSTMASAKWLAKSFRNFREAESCYNKFDETVFVSRDCQTAFEKFCKLTGKKTVLYNTNNSREIMEKSAEAFPESFEINKESFNWCGVGRLIPVKAFDRMLRIQKRLIDSGIDAHLFILGIGELRERLEKWCVDNEISDTVSFLGYQTNPYCVVSKCDLFVCSSISEGFSTAATEALIVGTPVCTVEVSGMKEMLGENNEYGIVTENDEEALYQGIKSLLYDPEKLSHYKRQAEIGGKAFSTEETVKAVEEMLENL